MFISFELLPGIYLAEIYAGKEDNLFHHFTVFHHHNDLRLTDAAEIVLRLIRENYLPSLPEQVRTTRVVLVKDSLWEGLHAHLQQIQEQDGCWIKAVILEHSRLYTFRDYAELAVCFINLANLPQEYETALDGLTADPGEGALACVQACLEMVRRSTMLREPGQASKLEDEFRAVLDEAIEARLDAMRKGQEATTVMASSRD